MSGIGFALTLLFVLLKGFGAVSWTWLTVLLPLLIGAGVDVLLFVAMIALQAAGLAAVTKSARR